MRRSAVSSLLQCGINRFADDISRIRSRSRNELLRAAIVDFGRVEIPVLIDAESVHSPESAGKVSPSAPGVQEMSFEVILQHSGSAAVIGPQRTVGSNIQKVRSE